MVVCILIVAGGLFLSIIGIWLTFISNPPSLELMKGRQTAVEQGREILDKATERSLLTRDEIKAAGEKAAREEEQKLEFSVAGKYLLMLGAVVQLIGTVSQVVLLTCQR